MPKETQNRAHAHWSPYTLASSARRQTTSTIKSKDTDEWDEVLCPVCMDHPHNAVMLLCSSHKNGCRPFLCNTSTRHSNCLNQYRKSFSETGSQVSESSKTVASDKLLCPLCRGLVSSWVVDEPARRYMDLKERACSVETCEFNGKYNELRRHAKEVHPTVHPSDVDPERQRNWRTMERQRDLGDLFSMLNSEMDIAGGSETSLDPGTDLNIGSGRGTGSLMVFFVGQSTVSHMLLRHRRSFSQSMLQFTSGPRAIVMVGERYLEGRNTNGNDATDGENNAIATTNTSNNGLTGEPEDNPVRVPSPPPLQDNELSDG
ncbi:hypothetical protein LUZ62_033909 [Rhynchospora pubera]|uniref:Uncharacterized protein n=1 Tax=Rhynchospora pubera TaxID=906938 RepID=A0AAV8I055_9POAL|nr:hypothetical protein LUZ62_033909 [Rhynchospora pubera]